MLREICVGLPVCVCVLSSAYASEDTITLRRFLNSIPAKINVYFTIEEASKRGEEFQSLSSRLVSGSVLDNNASKTDVIELLKKWLPDAEIRVSPSKPTVVNIMDKRLVNLKRYALNETMPEVFFSGAPSGLLEYISQRVPLLTTNIVITTVLTPRFDMSTRIKINDKNLNVRDSITNYLPLEDYNKLLWVASTDLETGVSQVEFSGLKNSGEPEKKAK